MPLYEIIQLKRTDSPTTLQFPVVPLESLVLSVEERTTNPALAVVTSLTQMTASPSPPTKEGQVYYNTDTHKLHTAIENGGAYSWSLAGTDPEYGVVYKGPGDPSVSNTLYVKSVVAGITSLDPIGQPRDRYDGPFAVTADSLSNSRCNCTVEDRSQETPTRAGCVGIGPSMYFAPVASNIVVSNGSSLYLVGYKQNDVMSFRYQTSATVGASEEVMFITRLADNRGGVMKQIQRSDITMGITTTTQVVPVSPLGSPTVVQSPTVPTTGTVTLTATYDSRVVSKLCKSSGAATWSNYSEPLILSTNGAYVFTGITAANEYTPEKKVVVSNIDHTAPVIQSAWFAATSLGGAATTANNSGFVRVQATDNLQLATHAYYWKVGAGEWEGPDSVNYKRVTENNTTVQYKVVDYAGNVSEPGTFTVTQIVIPANPPAAPTVTHLPTAFTNGTVTITAVYSQDSTQKKFQRPGSTTWEDYTQPLTATENGTWSFKGINSQGDDSQIVTHTIDNIDTTAPTITSIFLAATSNGTAITGAGPYASGFVRVIATDNKGLAANAYTWNVNGTTIGPTSSSYVLVTANGRVTCSVIDSAGNISAISGLDITNVGSRPDAPQVSQSTTAPTNQDVTLTVTYSSDSTQKMYKGPSDATWKNYTQPIVVQTNGTYQFKGINSQGFESPVVTWQVTNIDKTPPTVLLAYDGESPLGQILVTATLANSENFPIYLQFKRNEGDAWGTSYAYDPNAPLINNGWYRYYATDGVGNTGENIVHITNIIEQEERD